jgi:hypothetical protein
MERQSFSPLSHLFSVLPCFNLLYGMVPVGKLWMVVASLLVLVRTRRLAMRSAVGWTIEWQGRWRSEGSWIGSTLDFSTMSKMTSDSRPDSLCISEGQTPDLPPRSAGPIC